MKVVHAIADHQASRARATALAAEGQEMAEVTSVGRTAFLASRARRAETLAPQPLYPGNLDALFDSQVFAASLVRAQLPVQALKIKAGIADDEETDEMPPWLGIGSSTAWFDDRLQAQLLSGTRQVVSLGSGLDCRAIRLEQPQDTLFIEVDEGALLDFKVRRLEAAGLQPYPATLVKGNYLKLDLVDELSRAGLDVTAPVAVLWEANTMYLPQAEALTLLATLLDRLPSCTVIFDYFTAPVAGVDGPQPTGCADTDRELEIVVRAVGDGAWLLVGPWDSEAAQRRLQFEVLEEHSLAEVVQLMRGAEIAGPLLERYRRDFEVGLHACQNFCVVRPGPQGRSRES